MMPSAPRSCGCATGKTRALARVGRAGEKAAFLNILGRATYYILILVALGSTVHGAGNASAADTEGWAAIAEQKVLYTSNAFQLSSARRLSLSEDPSQPTIVQLDKPSDIVWEPSVDVRRTSSNRLGDLEVSVKAHGFIFTDHAALNHGNYRIQVKQALSPDTSVLLRYRYVPNLFLGPNTERRTGSRLLEEERVTSHSWRLQLERRVTDSSVVTLVGRHGLRFYNEAFAERDTMFWTLGPRLAQQVNSWAGVTLEYLYERGVADGRDQPQFKDDVSYRQHFMSFGTTFELGRPLSLNLAYVYRHKEFTSEIVGDLNRGLIDVTHQGTAEFSYRFTAAATATLGFQHTQRTSNASVRGFNDTNTSLGIQYRF
ncbi:MAG: hypothetical protein HY444_08675 [Nitrospirae bacterium]|nr:hypothetical protein [Nitrospirota bacterium]